MQNTPRERLMHYAGLLQRTLLGALEADVDGLWEKARLVTGVLEVHSNVICPVHVAGWGVRRKTGTLWQPHS